MDIINKYASYLEDNDKDDSDINEPLRSFIDVYDDGNKSHIVIKKDLSIKSTPSYNFSFNEHKIV